MKFNFLGYEFNFSKVENINKEKTQRATEAKIEKTLNTLESAISKIIADNGKLTNYNIQKVSGLSINTIKKYKKEKEDLIEKLSKNTIKLTN